ncbi:MAG: hypothetical protein Q4G68_13680 [Planctomycetia bacterium]|nr:hypothetical protein [Planctomycetia bacterium]
MTNKKTSDLSDHFHQEADPDHVSQQESETAFRQPAYRGHNTCWVIVPSEHQATVWRLSEDESVSFTALPMGDATLAQSIANLLREQQYESQPILLAPLQTDVLAVSLPPGNATARQTMLYELEEYVPIPAERYVADFVLSSEARFAGVIDLDRFLPLLDELATQEILVQAIVPRSILTAQGLTQNAAKGSQAIIWGDCEEDRTGQNGLDLFFFTADGFPRSWQWLKPTPDTLRRAIEAERTDCEEPISVFAINLPNNLRESLNAIPQIILSTNSPEGESEGPDLLQRAFVKQSLAVLMRKTRPWWDFCHDQFAMRGTDRILGRYLRIILWGVVALAAAFCLLFATRGYRYVQLTEQYRQEQEVAFREALPDQKLQTGFRNRLESEYTKMFAQRENTAELPQRESVLIPILQILQSLPQNVRYRFPEIRIEPGTVRLDGQLQVHGDAETLATALEKGGFAVEPPSTQQTGASGVSVRLTVLRK